MVTTEPARVPVRTILATIGLLLGTGLAVLFVIQVQRVLVWMLVAGFFTVALYPVVAWVQRRLSWVPGALATLLVFLLVFLVLGGLLALFAVPLAQEGIQLAGQLPGSIADARAGRGPVGELLTRTNALQWVQDNQDTHPRVRHRARSPGAERRARGRHRGRRHRHRVRAVLPGRAGRTQVGGRHAGVARADPRRADPPGRAGLRESPSPATSRATC